MNVLLRFPLFAVLYGCFLMSATPVSAMSSSPEDAPEPGSAKDASAIKRGTQYEQCDPEADARAAIEQGDLRLLGFATRATTLPGVAAADREAALDACGVRLLEGFGDVIRSDEELAAMRKASAYAKRYNAVMLGVCLGDK
ncbi:MAG: hypothetical protein PF589_10325 [Gammaproteobacteria bacterium]|jgi:hypothetical protein|nr:hypothetical protein [Gammaproteobacteria bacterium]